MLELETTGTRGEIRVFPRPSLVEPRHAVEARPTRTFMSWWLAVLAIADYLYQRYSFYQKNRMTKQELKEAVDQAALAKPMLLTAGQERWGP